MIQSRNKIIIIDHEPYSERRKKNYFIDEFSKDNFEILYWEVKNVFDYSKKVEYKNVLRNNIVTVFDDFSLLSQIIKDNVNTNTVFIIEIPFNLSTLKFYKLLSFLNVKYVKIDYYYNPVLALDSFAPIMERVGNFRLTNIYSKFVNRFILNYFYSKYDNPNLYYLTGSYKICNLHRNNLVLLDHFDIIETEKVKFKKPLIKKKYIIFLDTMLVNHPDFKLMGFAKNLIDSKYYYAKMNQYFDYVEMQTGYVVIVASHPKANYINEFGGRKCFNGVSAELVKDCEFVLTHGSLSISYALLNQKPIVYLYFGNAFRKNSALSYILYRIFKAKEVLDCNIVDLEMKFDFSIINLTINLEKYNTFLFKYYRKKKNDYRSNYSIVKESLISLLSIN